EAVALANNTRYGLSASVWTENVNRALEVAARIKAGVVWINCTNLFDAAAGFGGYRESGFGREGGREGMWEYLKTTDDGRQTSAGRQKAEGGKKPAAGTAGAVVRRLPSAVAVDRTPKLFIAGNQ